MGTLRLAFLGDVVGSSGRKAVHDNLPTLREEWSPDLVVINAENARNGSGLTPEMYGKLRAYGINGVTLGDHWHREPQITPVLEKADEPIIRPANLPQRAPGRHLLRLEAPSGKSVFVVTVLGRLFLTQPVGDPFETVDHILASLPDPDGIVIVEAHMEATSEKAALAFHLDGRVAAVVGTHTHVPTADARILPRGTALVSDLGMSGPYESVIGRDAAAVVGHLTTGMHNPFPVASGDTRIAGAVIDIDEAMRVARGIRVVQYPPQRHGVMEHRGGA